MYSTSDIASFLGIQRTNVNYYIRKGHLKATMIDGFYVITPQDYYTFRDEYFDSNKRFSSRGPTKKLTDEQVELLKHIVIDMQDNKVSLEEFKNKYKEVASEIPHFKVFVIYKRDASIRYDRSLGKRYKKLAQEYNLSEKSIQKIVNKDRELYL
jgi:DNA-binding CsgD family transcriptional regulator